MLPTIQSRHAGQYDRYNPAALRYTERPPKAVSSTTSNKPGHLMMPVGTPRTASRAVITTAGGHTNVVGVAVVGDALVGDALVGDALVGDALVGDGDALVGDALGARPAVGDAVGAVVDWGACSYTLLPMPLGVSTHV